MYKLKLRLTILTAALFFQNMVAAAQADCASPPPQAMDYLKTQDGWTLLTEADLIPDQQMLWDQDHPDECPGLAVANLSGGPMSIAIAIVQHPVPGVIYERLVLVGDTPESSKDLAGPEEMDFPSVVYRAPPGRAFDFKTRKYVPTPHDSIVYEHWNSITKTFFLAGGKVQMVQSSY